MFVDALSSFFLQVLHSLGLFGAGAKSLTPSGCSERGSVLFIYLTLDDWFRGEEWLVFPKICTKKIIIGILREHLFLFIFLVERRTLVRSISQLSTGSSSHLNTAGVRNLLDVASIIGYIVRKCFLTVAMNSWVEYRFRCETVEKRLLSPLRDCWKRIVLEQRCFLAWQCFLLPTRIVLESSLWRASCPCLPGLWYPANRK